MAEPVSDEVREMQARERARWLTVAEAQRLRTSWDTTRAAVDELAEKFDADPEDESQAQLFILIASLTVSGFGKAAHEAVTRLNELTAKRSGGEH